MPSGKLPVICRRNLRQLPKLLELPEIAGIAKIVEIAEVAGIARIAIELPKLLENAILRLLLDWLL